MNLADMERRLNLVVQDKILAPEFAAMINDAILEIAADFDLPALKLLTPHSFPVDSSTWLFALPENYHKKLFRCLDSDGNEVTVLSRVEDLEKMDLEHEDTGDHVTHVAVVDTGVIKYLCTYPLAEDTLRLWFYEKPNNLSDPEDVCNCIPAEFFERVTFPKIFIKNHQLLTDQVVDFDLKPLQYWEGKQREGLYGSAAGPIGFINWIIKQRGGPRRHGGRDPIM